MEKSYFLDCLQLLCLSAGILSIVSCKICVINPVQANDTHSCNTSSVKCNLIPAQDLTNINWTHSEVDIYFCFTDYSINTNNSVVNFTNLTRVAMTGASTGSSIHCNTNRAGFYFKNVKNIAINNLQLINCGFENLLKEFQVNFNVTLYIVDSANITLVNVGIQNSSGIGLAMANCSGQIKMVNSNIDNNHASDYQNAGGGMFIESSESNDTTYNFESCKFTNNGANNDPRRENHFLESDVINFVSGGGVNIYFRAETSKIDMTFKNCLFENNTAIHGGALSVSFQYSANHVSVTIFNSTFKNNSAAVQGGAVLAEYVKGEKVDYNIVLFLFCNFTRNKGKKGGAVYLNAAPKRRNFNKFRFSDCNWEKNEGTHGSAVMIARYPSKWLVQDEELPVPNFDSCSFRKNIDLKLSYAPAKHVNVSQHGRGAVYINSFKVKLSGKMIFMENSRNSAVQLFASILVIAANTSALFQQNVGYQGGAISLRGFSSIQLHDNTIIDFCSNYARNQGGAIFHWTLIDPTMLAENCFITYAGDKEVADRNISLNFVNNTIVNPGEHHREYNRGKSIFLSSSIPCSRLYQGDDYNVEQVLHLIANFSFDADLRNDTIATYPSNFTIDESFSKVLIPGKLTKLNVHAKDDMQNKVPSTVYKIEIRNPNITVDPDYTITQNNMIKLLGIPGSKGKLYIIPELEDIDYRLEVVLEECPPGYIYNNVSSVCECSASTETLHYLGIQRCDLTVFQAIILRSYWAGYRSDPPSDESFRTSNCPRGYCKSNKSEISLPERAIAEDIYELICVSNRTGVICGECKNNTSMYYHSQGSNNCRSNEKCHYGILLFIASEILPVTALFLTVILLDIQLTTGSLNGFLFYTQMFYSLDITANNNIKFLKVIDVLRIALNSIFTMFNLNFFVIPGLQFCLFKNATTLDVHTFDYIITVYALLLVILTVIGLNQRCSKRFKILQGRNNTSSIHGLSGFLVLCYAKTTNITLTILTPGYIHGKRLEHHETVVFHQGNIGFFHKEHLKYAIPALFALVFITCIPPLLLLVYPLCYKILAVLGLEQSKFTKLLCKVMPLEKFKPLFDSFQGDFKDKHRYFAGLYFIYRLIAQIVFAFLSYRIEIYAYLQLFLIFVLVLHGWIQPYKKKWHNRFNLYLFALMAFINGINMHNYVQTMNLQSHKQTIDFFSTVQVLLAYSPLVVMLIYGFQRLRKTSFFMRVRRKLKKRSEADTVALSLSMLDERRHDQESEVNYRRLHST